MADRELQYVISSTHDSTLIAQVLETRGLGKYPYFLSFENFQGELHYDASHPEGLRLNLNIDATTVICRTGSLRASQQRRRAVCARNRVLQAPVHPAIHFSSSHVSVKALRGLVVEGTLQVRGATCAHKLNAVFTPLSADCLEMEGDSLVQLSDFGIPAPSSQWGLIRTGDPVLIHWHLCAAPTAGLKK